MNNFTKIRLHGELGEEVGPEWELEISSVGEALRAIELHSRRKLFKHFIEKDKEKIKYKILINENLVTYGKEINAGNATDIQETELCMNIKNLETIDVIPVFEGAKCLLAGTKISMADGSSKNIEDIMAGDMVTAYNETKGTFEEAEVSKTFEHPETEGYLVINEQMKLTENHPIYVMNRGWITASELSVGDILMYKDGTAKPIEKIDVSHELVTTFNIEVEKYHNYFADGYLVHNKGILGIILGAVLMLAAIFIPGLNVYVAMALFAAGAGLMAAGIMTMLAKPPTMEPPKDIEIKGATSYLFSNIVNTNKEGNPVPVCYGTLRIGSYVLESTYDTYNVQAIESPSNSEQISTINSSITVINPADEIIHT